MLPAHFQQRDLLFQCPAAVKVRAVQDAANLLQRELQFPEKQNALQPLQGTRVIQPVPGLRHPGGFQQPDAVIVMQRPDADARSLADLMHGHHGPHLLCKGSIRPDAA